jgi:lysophospholipase L1-like esterase
MKKTFLFLTFALFSLVLLACTETTTEASASLSAPTNLAIVDNVVTFDDVDDATAYSLTAKTPEGTIVRTFPVESGLDLALLLDFGSYLITVKAVGDSEVADSADSSAVSAVITDINGTDTLSAASLNDEDYIAWLGRTRYDDSTEVVSFFYTASGFEVGFFGTTLSATFTASNTDNLGKRPILVVLIDGEENPLAGLTITLKEAESSSVLVDGLDYGYHTVKVLKRSESTDSDTGLKSLTTDGHFAAPDEVKDLNILFIGDSLTVGYGNRASSPGIAKTTSNSDGLIAFAYLAAYIHDAGCSIVAASGWGISRGWNTGGAIDEVENMVNAFDYIAIDSTSAVRTDWGTWDTASFVPDVIVITLGANDFNAPGYDAMDETAQTALRETYVADYLAYVLHLGSLYPDAPIIIAYGFTGDADRVGSSDLSIIAQANTSLGDRVVGIELPSCSSNCSYGSDYHPQVAMHIQAAEALADEIALVTGHARVRDNIEW